MSPDGRLGARQATLVDATGCPRAGVVAGHRGVESRTHIDSENEPIKIAPTVVAFADVQGRPRDALVIMSMEGELINDVTASLVGAVGDLVVAAVDRCQYAGFRKGKEVWRTKNLPCTYHEVPPPRLLRHRMYLGTHHDNAGASAFTVSLDAKTGQETGRFLRHKDDQVTYGYGIGPGRAYITLESGRSVVLARARRPT